MSNKQHTRAALAAGTAIHALAFTVIAADAPAKHTIRMLYPWSTLTDGGLLLRRLKGDVLQDLPPKIIQDYCRELSPLQVSLLLWPTIKVRH